jgi:hypothetical protein
MATATNLIQLKPSVIEEIKKNLSAKNRLQFELHKSYLTIQRWLNENSSNLTTATALKIISEELGCKIDDLLTGA